MSMTKGDLSNRIVSVVGQAHIADKLTDTLWPYIEEALDDEYRKGYDDGSQNTADSIYYGRDDC